MAHVHIFRKILPTGSTIPPSNVKKTVSVGSPGPARLTAVTFAENGTKAPGGFTHLQSIQKTNRNRREWSKGTWRVYTLTINTRNKPESTGERLRLYIQNSA